MPQAESENPDNATLALQHFNSAQQSQYSVEEKIARYRLALDYQPAFPMAAWNLGILYQQSRRYEALDRLYTDILAQKVSLVTSTKVSSLSSQLTMEPTVTTAHQLSSGTVSVAQVPFRAGVLFYLANLRGAYQQDASSTATDKKDSNSVEVSTE